jgi:hypothetical protein
VSLPRVKSEKPLAVEVEFSVFCVSGLPNLQLLDAKVKRQGGCVERDILREEKMRRLLVGLIVGFVTLGVAQVQVFETEAFTFSTDMGDASVTPTGIISELSERYQAKGMDLGEADARLVPLDITVTSGMGNLELDLTGLNVSVLMVTSDMGDISVILSDVGTTTGSLTSGMGDISLQLPASRSLAVVESVTGMGDIIIDAAVTETGTGSPVTLDLTTDMGEILIAPVGTNHSEAMSEDAAPEESMDEESSEEMTTDTTVTTDAAGSGSSQTTVTLDGAITVTSSDGNVEVDVANGTIAVTDVNFSEEVITVDGMGGSQTFDCAGKNVVVNGTQLDLTLTGICGTIEINGATNTITVDAVRSLVLNGLGNKVMYVYTLNSTEPTAELTGLNNTVERKE